MPNIQIKNVPAEAHAVHRRRAAEAGQSLQEYLLAMLIRDAAQPTIDEIFAAPGHEGGVADPEEIVAMLRAGRDSH